MSNSTEAAAPPAKTAAHKRQFRNYLLNKRFQLQYTLVMVFVSAIIMGLLIWQVSRKQEVASKQLIMFAADTFQGDPAVQEEITAQIRADVNKNDRNTLLTLIAGGVGLLGFLGVFGIIMTHKVAGPLYKITLYFQKMKSGDFSKVYNLRKGDQLVEFFTEFKDMHDSLRTKQAAEAQRIGELLERIEKAGIDKNPDVADAYAAVKQLREQKEKSLGK